MSTASISEVGFNRVFPEAIARWREIAVNCKSFESAALLLRDGTVRHLPNLSPEPHRHFIFDPKLLVTWGRPVGLLHSHPLAADGSVQASPSALDMEMQVTSGMPWGLSIIDEDGKCADPVWWGDQLPIRPLLGRVFLHGINDCYSLIRDWYRLKGITLPDFPRSDGWWREPGLDLYGQGFEKARFRRVEVSEIRPGDVVLFSVVSRVLNHGGVYLGDDVMLHHLHGTLSSRVPLSKWASRIRVVLRHRELGDTPC